MVNGWHTSADALRKVKEERERRKNDPKEVVQREKASQKKEEKVKRKEGDWEGQVWPSLEEKSTLNL